MDYAKSSIAVLGMESIKKKDFDALWKTRRALYSKIKNGIT